jgi:hypothetical protein
MIINSTGKHTMHCGQSFNTPQHPPIIVGNQNKPRYSKVPEPLAERVWLARLTLSLKEEAGPGEPD